MKSALLTDDRERTFALVFERGDEVLEGLTVFAERHGLCAAHFTGIGALSDVTLAYFDVQARAYRELPLAEQVEVLSLVGNVTDAPGGRKVHAHVVVGRADGTTRGGHLLRAEVCPTLEVFVTETDGRLMRAVDEASGLPLVELEE